MSKPEEFGGNEIVVTNESIKRLSQFLEGQGVTDTADTDLVLEKASELFGEGYTMEDVRAIVQELYRREQATAAAIDAEMDPRENN